MKAKLWKLVCRWFYPHHKHWRVKYPNNRLSIPMSYNKAKEYNEMFNDAEGIIFEP